MDIYKDMLCKALGEFVYDLIHENLQLDYNHAINSMAVQALDKIRAILQNDALSDFQCVEEILSVIEGLGSDGGNRHDFS